MTDQTKIELFPVSMIENTFAHPAKDPHGSGKEVVGIPLAGVPDGMKLQSLKPFFDEYRHKPDRRKGSLSLRTASFVEYVGRYRNSDTTVLFVTPARLFMHRMTVVFNYHPAGAEITLTGAGDFRISTLVWKKEEVLKLAREINLTPWFGETP